MALLVGWVPKEAQISAAYKGVLPRCISCRPPSGTGVIPAMAGAEHFNVLDIEMRVVILSFLCFEPRLLKLEKRAELFYLQMGDMIAAQHGESLVVDSLEQNGVGQIAALDGSVQVLSFLSRWEQ